MSSLPSSRTQWSIVIICLAVLALLFGMWARYNLHGEEISKPVFLSATLFDQPRSVTPFKLTDTNNHNFGLDNFKGHWSLVFFGFTNCPDLCPTTLATLNQTYKVFEKNPTMTKPQVVFISVDPEQDNPAKIKNYLSSFNPNFLGATGSESQIGQLTQELSVMFTKILPANSEQYSIDHSGTIVIINPQGQFSGVFTLPHDPNKIAQDVQTLIASSASPTNENG